jgi:hypothetical protein
MSIKIKITITITITIQRHRAPTEHPSSPHIRYHERRLCRMGMQCARHTRERCGRGHLQGRPMAPILFDEGVGGGEWK